METDDGHCVVCRSAPGSALCTSVGCTQCFHQSMCKWYSCFFVFLFSCFLFGVVWCAASFPAQEALKRELRVLISAHPETVYGVPEAVLYLVDPIALTNDKPKPGTHPLLL